MAYGEEYAGKQREREMIAGALGNTLTPRDECGPSVNYGKPLAALHRSSTRERIERTLAEAQSTYERAAAAQRAKELIEKHPEVAELLDLLNRF